MIKKFEPFDEYKEYADIGLKVNADEIEQLYYHAATGMLKMMFDLSRIRGLEKVKINIEASSKEELLVNFLNAILDQIHSKGKAIAAVKIMYFDPQHIKAELSGEDYNHNKHLKKGDIKRVIFRDLEIKKMALEIDGPLVWHAELRFTT